MPNVKKYNYNQNAMVVINFEEQIQPGTFEFTLWLQAISVRVKLELIMAELVRSVVFAVPSLVLFQTGIGQQQELWGGHSSCASRAG